MIYQNEDGVNIIEMGSGGIEVASGVPTIGPGTCVVFTAQESEPVGEISKQAFKKYGDRPAIRTDAHTMLIFTNPQSIGVVIAHLEKAKKAMENDDLSILGSVGLF